MDEPIITYNTLEVGDDGRVEGNAHTAEKDGYTITATVTSYTYTRDGEVRMNNVPNVVISDAEGSIVSEPHARDSENPRQAIKNAEGMMKEAYKNLGEYVG